MDTGSFSSPQILHLPGGPLRGAPRAPSSSSLSSIPSTVGGIFFLLLLLVSSIVVFLVLSFHRPMSEGASQGTTFRERGHNGGAVASTYTKHAQEFGAILVDPLSGWQFTCLLEQVITPLLRGYLSPLMKGMVLTDTPLTTCTYGPTKVSNPSMLPRVTFVAHTVTDVASFTRVKDSITSNFCQLSF